MKVGLIVPFLEIYPDATRDFETFKSLLSNLDRTNSLSRCAQLNLKLSSDINDHMSLQDINYRMFFPKEALTRIDNFKEKHRNVQLFAIFYRTQLLELIRWISLFCEDQYEEEDTFESEEIRHTFGMVALMAGEFWQNRVFRSELPRQDNPITHKKWLKIERLGAENTLVVSHAFNGIGRGWEIFNEIFPQLYPEFEVEFKAKTTLSLDEYYNCTFAIAALYWADSDVKRLDNTIHEGVVQIDSIFSLIPNHTRNLLERYFDLISQTPDELRQNLWNDKTEASLETAKVVFSYKPLRQKPLLRISDDQAIVIDPIFFEETATVGPLFHVLGNNNKFNHSLFENFGLAFQAYCGNILKSMYPASSGLASRLSCPLNRLQKK